MAIRILWSGSTIFRECISCLRVITDTGIASNRGPLVASHQSAQQLFETEGLIG